MAARRNGGEKMKENILVLGAGIDRKGPGPIVTELSKASGSSEVPIVIVPGSLSKEQLEAIV